LSRAKRIVNFEGQRVKEYFNFEISKYNLGGKEKKASISIFCHHFKGRQHQYLGLPLFN
jgi:hypothetical protein